MSVLSQEADVASGNDVDGRLSLSSANNIQHRPGIYPSYYLHRCFPPCAASRPWKRDVARAHRESGNEMEIGVCVCEPVPCVLCRYTRNVTSRSRARGSARVRRESFPTFPAVGVSSSSSFREYFEGLGNGN